MNSLRKILNFLIIAAAIILLAPICLLIITVFLFNVALSPPDFPEIKYGEFPFKITYEYNGETTEIEDICVCEFNGVNTTAGGKYRSWKQYFKSGNEDVLTIYKDDTFELGFSIGSAEYFMNDTKFHTDEPPKPTAYLIRYTDKGKNTVFLSADELYSELGIKITSWEFSEPIENTFRPKKWYERQFFY